LGLGERGLADRLKKAMQDLNAVDKLPM